MLNQLSHVLVVVRVSMYTLSPTGTTANTPVYCNIVLHPGICDNEPRAQLELTDNIDNKLENCI